MLSEMEKKGLAGISCVLCGFLYFVHELNIFCSDMLIFDPKIYPLYVAVIFFLGKQRDIALLSAVIGIVIWFPQLLDLMDNYADLIWPIIIIGVGVLLLLTSKRIGGKKKSDDTIEDAQIVDDEETQKR